MQPWEVKWCLTTLYHLIQHQWEMLLGFSLRYPWCLFLLWCYLLMPCQIFFPSNGLTVSCNSIRSGQQLPQFKTVRICHGFLMTHHSWDRKIFLTFSNTYLVSRLYSWPSILIFVSIILNWVDEFPATLDAYSSGQLIWVLCLTFQIPTPGQLCLF